eukprot:6473971-Amphidinium_carterae.2
MVDALATATGGIAIPPRLRTRPGITWRAQAGTALSAASTTSTTVRLGFSCKQDRGNAKLNETGGPSETPSVPATKPGGRLEGQEDRPQRQASN